MPPHGAIHGDEDGRGVDGDQEDHRERRVLLGGADTGRVPSHQGRPGRRRPPLQATRPGADRGVAPTGRRAPRRQEPPRVHLPGERRLVGDRRHDRRVADAAPLRRPGRRVRRLPDGVLLPLQPDALGHAPGRARGRTDRAPRGPVPAPGQHAPGLRAGHLQLPRPALRQLTGPVPQARRSDAHGGGREDPRREPGRQAGDRELPAPAQPAWAHPRVTRRAEGRAAP